jgi:hypothetical protein
MGGLQIVINCPRALVMFHQQASTQKDLPSTSCSVPGTSKSNTLPDILTSDGMGETHGDELLRSVSQGQKDIFISSLSDSRSCCNRYRMRGVSVLDKVL